MILPGDLIIDRYIALRGPGIRVVLGRQDIGLVVGISCRHADRAYDEVFIMLPSGVVGRINAGILNGVLNSDEPLWIEHW